MNGFQTPPECQGQIVVVSYMAAGDCIYKMVFDQSDRSVDYYVAEIEGDDWEWYEDWEACNGSPPIFGDRWMPMDEGELKSLFNKLD